MAFTGQQHTRFLIAAKMIESFCQRSNLHASIHSSTYYLTFYLPEQAGLHSSMLAEWSDIIGKYKNFSYKISIMNNQYAIRID